MPQKRYDWPPILTAAAAREISAKELSKELGCTVERVYQAQDETGIRLKQGKRSTRNDETYGVFIVEPCTSLDEEWRPAVSWEGLYEVSSFGRVRNTRTSYIKKVLRNWNDYSFVSLTRAGKGVQYYLHRLVARNFVSNPNGFTDVNHKDRDKSNNAHWNLEWISHQANIDHAFDQKIMFAGVNPKCIRKLSVEQVADIRRLAANGGVSLNEIGRRFGVHGGYVAHIVKGQKRIHG